jgi:nitrite reductase (NADH) small subunit/3-phenylpropionate/trans-cinnamate dioxygenase ferredoxin subunit
MSEFITVAKVGCIEEGQGTTVEAGDRMLALFLYQGEYRVIDDLCPHQGASLGAGHLDEEGAVTCPWHAWRFSTCDGTWCDNPRLKVDTYEVRVEGDNIQVRLPD